MGCGLCARGSGAMQSESGGGANTDPVFWLYFLFLNPFIIHCVPLWSLCPCGCCALVVAVPLWSLCPCGRCGLVVAELGSLSCCRLQAKGVGYGYRLWAVCEGITGGAEYC